MIICIVDNQPEMDSTCFGLSGLGQISVLVTKHFDQKTNKCLKHIFCAKTSLKINKDGVLQHTLCLFTEVRGQWGPPKL